MPLSEIALLSQLDTKQVQCRLVKLSEMHRFVLKLGKLIVLKTTKLN